MRKLLWIAVLACVLGTSALGAQTRGPRVAGKVLDSTGAVMPGTDVKLSQGPTVVGTAKTDNNGEFSIDAPVGEYKLEVSAPDFKPFDQTVRVTPNLAPLSISLTLAILTTEVQVTTQNNQVTIDAESTLTTTNIDGDKIKELPDDEEMLLTYLQQLAQASGAQGNANLLVDGIGGGRVPTKDQIQQIIINTNTFSATNNGGATIEIITRPGTQKWTGQVNLAFADSAFEAKGPFDATKPRKSQHQIQTSVSGTLIPGRLTSSFQVRTLRAESEGNSLRAITENGPVSDGVKSPTINRQFGTNGQLYLSKINTLNFNFGMQTQRNDNQGVGGFNLAERASNRKGRNWQVQFNERAIFSPTFIHEVRFRINKNENKISPATEAISINVIDSFYGGGAQNRVDNRNTNLNWGNNVRYQYKQWSLQAGTEFTYTKTHNDAIQNNLGAYTFSSLADWIAKRPVQYRRTITLDSVVDVSQLDFASFFQADWRVNPKASLGFGVRYQAQTNLSDYNNIAPTLQFSYQLRQGTVVRIGARQFYNNFGLGNVEQLIRQDGKTKTQEIVVLNPVWMDPALENNNLAASATASSIRLKEKNLIAPSTSNVGISLDHNITKTWRAGFSVNIDRSVHQIRTRNINAPFPGTALPDELLNRLRSSNPATQAAARAEVDRMRPFYPFIGNMNQFESAGNSLSKNLQFRLVPPSNLSFFRNKFGITGQVQYAVNWRDDDNGAVNQYDWSEWAPSAGTSRHNVFSTLSLRLPAGFSANMPIEWFSGALYNISTGRDENGDQNTNDRPIGVSRNSAVGPSYYNVNMVLNKTFNLKRSAPSPARAALPQGLPIQIPTGGGQLQGNVSQQQIQEAIARGQIPAGIGQPTQQGPYTGPRMSINIQIRNLLNNTQLFGYSGVMTSSLFGEPTGARAARAIRGNISFSWQ